MALRCVYTDLDGTLLGKGASLFRDGEGGFTLLPARALEACFRAGVEVVIKSGRKKAQVHEDARLFGQTSYIYEVGGGLVVDGEEEYLTGSFQPGDGETVHSLVESTGAPSLLLSRYPEKLEHHAPWHLDRHVSHLFRGLVDTDEANALLEAEGLGQLRLVDNGVIGTDETELLLPGLPHAYHLVPREASKAAAVRRHMQIRGYEPEQCIAVGDSREDLDVASSVGRFWVVANAIEKDPAMASVVASLPNVSVTEASNGDGFYEAVISTLAGAT